MKQGLAYVDFEDEETLAAAVAKNNQKLCLRGQEVSIARSNPTGGRARGRGFGAGSGMLSWIWCFILIFRLPSRAVCFVFSSM